VATEVSGGWLGLLEDLRHDELVSTARLEGGLREAPASLRLAQALYHGTEHRSQIAVGLSALGATPPSTSVWDFGIERGLVHLTD